MNNYSIREKTKRKMWALKIFAETQKLLKQEKCGRNLVFAFDGEMGIPFQHHLLLDLRDKGIVGLAVTQESKTGFYLKETFNGFSMSEFHEYYKKQFND